jgi:hypothetical protein
MEVKELVVLNMSSKHRYIMQEHIQLEKVIYGILYKLKCYKNVHECAWAPHACIQANII